MRLAITGGGTGGHVFPALEVARLARDRGHEILYLGSFRGQESGACEREGFAFQGFASEPVYSLRTMRGLRAALRLLKASRAARARLLEYETAVLFSTGGYSAAPVVRAAMKERIPYVLLEANSVPGRSNAMFAREAVVVATVFRSTERFLKKANIVRTGMPIRAALREAAAYREEGVPTVLVTGGSQGSEFLNRAVPKAAQMIARSGLKWIHVAGRDHAASLRANVQALGVSNYEVHGFLNGPEMAKAYERATVLVGRSGGSLAEVAMFGIPSVLVPLPTAAGDHQTHNALEFEQMGAAVLHPQKESTPERLSADILGWLDSPEERLLAAQSLKEFDVPDATERILRLVEEAR